MFDGKGFECIVEQIPGFIEDDIVSHFSDEEKDVVRQRASKIVDDYVGLDSDAILVLASASKVGRFDEYATRLEQHFYEDLCYSPPPARRHPGWPGAVRAWDMLNEIYMELGVERNPVTSVEN